MGISVRELRIGNYLHYNGSAPDEYFAVTDLSESELADHEVNDITIKSCEPIPLTEEWLLKFGFEKITEGIWNKKSGSTILSMQFLESWFAVLSINGGDDCGLCDINYVHRLQNLYFALTNTELSLIL